MKIWKRTMNKIKAAEIKTAKNTDLLKLIAAISMLIDHVGAVFFPNEITFRLVGRLAFPIFAYCLAIGYARTSDPVRYLKRLLIFAVITQPFWLFAMFSHDIMGHMLWLNTIFTMFFALLTLHSIVIKNIPLLLVAVIPQFFLHLDYSQWGAILVLILFYSLKKPKIGALLFLLCYSIHFVVYNPYFAVTIGGLTFGGSLFATLSAPLIFFDWKFDIKLPRYFFYIFYPAHFALIGIVVNFM